jgi:hypothetical protein
MRLDRDRVKRAVALDWIRRTMATEIQRGRMRLMACLRGSWIPWSAMAAGWAFPPFASARILRLVRWRAFEWLDKALIESLVWDTDDRDHNDPYARAHALGRALARGPTIDHALAPARDRALAHQCVVRQLGTGWKWWDWQAEREETRETWKTESWEWEN